MSRHQKGQRVTFQHDFQKVARIQPQNRPPIRRDVANAVQGALDALQRAVRPEFLNRIDEIVVFDPLGPESIGQIAELQFAHLQERLTEQGITATLTDAAKSALAERGYDPVYGARPLKRTIQRELQDPLALKILQGQFKDGETVMVDVRDGELTFGK